MLRPLLAFASGIALAEGPGWHSFASLAALGTVAFAAGWRRTGEATFLLGLGGVSLALRLASPAPLAGPTPALFEVERSLPGPADRCQLSIRIHGRPAGRALLHASGELCDWLPGARALGHLKLIPLRTAGNPGGPDPSARWRRRGVQRQARVVEGRIVAVEPAPRGVAALLASLRRQIGDTVDPPQSPARAGAVLRALATGDRSGLTVELRESFARSGTAHLLAVSGLHVGWVFALAQLGVGALLRRTPGVALRRRARTVATAAALAGAAGYAALSGSGVPALRAVAMATAGGLALLGGRPSAAANALCAAGLLVLALEPAQLFAAPFALSFSAVAGILIWRPPVGARALPHATVAAGLATAPWVAALSAPLPAAALPANLIAVPIFAAAVVPAALLTGAIGTCSAPLAEALRPVASGLAEFGLRTVELLQSADMLSRFEQPVRTATLLAVSGFALRALATRRPALASIAIGVAAVLALAPQASDRVRSPQLLALDVGHGDAVLVRSARAAWLIDAGPRSASFDAGRSVVVPTLRAEGVRRLDVLVVTHSDRDHAGGAIAVLESLEVDVLWMTRHAAQDPATAELRFAAAKQRVPLRVVAAGDARTAPLPVQVLWPPAELEPFSSNESSIVLRVRFPGGCALLPGDAPIAVEQRLLPQQPCEILKLAHHGSRTSTAPELLDAIDPLLAIASHGPRPHAPLPHPSVQARLATRDVTLYDTARDGAVRVELGARGPLAWPFRIPGESAP